MGWLAAFQAFSAGKPRYVPIPGQARVDYASSGQSDCEAVAILEPCRQLVFIDFFKIQVQFFEQIEYYSFGLGEGDRNLVFAYTAN